MPLVDYANYRERYINEGFKGFHMNILNEPQLILGAVRACVLAAVSFGFVLTPEQIGSTMLALEAVLTLVGRTLVTPTRLVNQRMEEGRHPTTGDELIKPTILHEPSAGEVINAAVKEDHDGEM